jgi:hypothetical protein
MTQFPCIGGKRNKQKLVLEIALIGWSVVAAALTFYALADYLSFKAAYDEEMASYSCNSKLLTSLRIS